MISTNMQNGNGQDEHEEGAAVELLDAKCCSKLLIPHL